jgi:ribosomal-protein-alanine N-acetyltransferase
MNSDRAPIETQRLKLIPWSAGLASDYVRLMADPAVVRYGFGTPRTESQAILHLGQAIEEWETNGFGSYAITDRESGIIGGYVGVHAPWSFPDISPIMDVGVRVIADWWGTGRGLEAITPIMDIGFEVLNASGLAGVFLPVNKGARDINARLGMTFHSKRIYPGTRMAVEIHVASPDAWSAAKKANEEKYKRARK